MVLFPILQIQLLANLVVWVRFRFLLELLFVKTVHLEVIRVSMDRLLVRYALLVIILPAQEILRVILVPLDRIRIQMDLYLAHLVWREAIKMSLLRHLANFASLAILLMIMDMVNKLLVR